MSRLSASNRVKSIKKSFFTYWRSKGNQNSQTHLIRSKPNASLLNKKYALFFIPKKTKHKSVKLKAAFSISSNRMRDTRKNIELWKFSNTKHCKMASARR